MNIYMELQNSIVNSRVPFCCMHTHALYEVCLLKACVFVRDIRTNFTLLAGVARLTVAEADVVSVIVDTLPIVPAVNATCREHSVYHDYNMLAWAFPIL